MSGSNHAVLEGKEGHAASDQPFESLAKDREERDGPVGTRVGLVSVAIFGDHNHSSVLKRRGVVADVEGCLKEVKEATRYRRPS